MSTYKEINQSSYDELNKFLQEIDPNGNLKEFSGNISDDDPLLKPIEDYFQEGRDQTRAVLGIDIYRYSQYPEKKQRLIPVIFNLFYEATIMQCLQTQRFLFQKYKQDDFVKDFIHTGDGGFQIFDTPLHSLIFAIHFQGCVQQYNSYTSHPRLRSYVGDIELRYTMTYDNLFWLESNYFGPAIISNARILSKDKLNRCLIDYGTHDWFLRRTKGLETLKRFTFDEIVNLSDFKKENGYEPRNNISSQENGLFYRDGKESLLDIHVSKIGFINAKQNALDIFNLHLQAALRLRDDRGCTKTTPLVVSLGNLNTTGITDYLKSDIPS